MHVVGALYMRAHSLFSVILDSLAHFLFYLVFALQGFARSLTREEVASLYKVALPEVQTINLSSLSSPSKKLHILFAPLTSPSCTP
jgi:hypothetical protein